MRKIEANYREAGVSNHALLLFGIGDGVKQLIAAMRDVMIILFTPRVPILLHLLVAP